MKSILKKPGLFFVVILLISIQQLSAQTLKDFFNSSDVPLTYLGVDFTQAKVLNEMATASEIRDKQYPAINQVIINVKEAKKFNIAKAFDRPEVINDISFVNAKNAKIDVDKIAESGSNDVHFKNTTVESIVKSYDFGGKKGIGLMFIVETMNKLSVQALIHVTLIDMATKKVLLTEKFIEQPAGFGFRNYWVKTIFEALEDIKKSKYKEWKANAK